MEMHRSIKIKTPMSASKLKLTTKRKHSYDEKHIYDFTDASSEDDNVARGAEPYPKDSNLIWHGKLLHLKKMKVQLERLHEDNLDISVEEPFLSSDFYTCNSTLSNQPKEYNRSKINPETNCGVSSNISSEILYIDGPSSSAGHNINDANAKNINIININEENNSKHETSYDSSIQDNIIKAVENQTGRKIMSEESEAFFWDWILQKD